MESTLRPESPADSAKSTHRCPVVRVSVIEQHPDSTALGIVPVNVPGTPRVVVRLDEFGHYPLAIYIPPDTILPDQGRIRPRRFRGQLSVGMLLPIPKGWIIAEGEDAAPYLGARHYDADASVTKHLGGQMEAGPPFHCPVYDVDAIYPYETLLRGRYVRVEEKLHGANIRLCYSSAESRFYVGSHRTWQRETLTNIYWRAFGWDLREYLREFPDVVFYGEVFGPEVQQGFSYGLTSAEIRLFDVFNPAIGAFEERYYADSKYQLGYFAPRAEAGFTWGVSRSPSECLDLLKSLSETRSRYPLAPNIREGVIVRAWERDTTSPDVPYGRLIFKCVNWEYLAQKGR